MGAVALHIDHMGFPACCREQRTLKAGGAAGDLEEDEWQPLTDEMRAAKKGGSGPIARTMSQHAVSDVLSDGAADSLAKLEEPCHAKPALADCRSEPDVVSATDMPEVPETVPEVPEICQPLEEAKPCPPQEAPESGGLPEEPEPQQELEPVYHDATLEQARCSLTHLLAQANQAATEAERKRCEEAKAEAAEAEVEAAKAARAAATAKKKAAVNAEVKRQDAIRKKAAQDKKRKEDEAAKKAAEEAEAANRRMEEELARKRAEEEKKKQEEEKKREEDERKEEAKARKAKAEDRPSKRTSTGGRMPMGWRNKARGSKRASTASPAPGARI